MSVPGTYRSHPHTWVALIPYNLDELQAQVVAARQAGITGGTSLVLRPDMVRWEDVPPVGCFACEGLYTEVAGKPCAGQPPGRLVYEREPG
jgi:hypothetical protein